VLVQEQEGEHHDVNRTGCEEGKLTFGPVLFPVFQTVTCVSFMLLELLCEILCKVLHFHRRT
jgi:hypothetical protein